MKFAAAYDGLTILANRSDELVSIGVAGRTVKDLAVADMNADNRNDIVVLRDDQTLVIAFATANPAPNGPYFAGTSTWLMSAGGSSATTGLALGDMDGDGDRDVVVTGSGSKIIWRKNNNNGTFGAASSIAAGVSPQNIEMALVNAGTNADVLVSGDNGKFAYLRSTGVSFAAPAVHKAFPPAYPTPGMLIAAGRVCPGHPNDIAVVTGALDEVKVACGDGSGDFASVVEPHGDTIIGEPTDYWWDLSFGQVTVMEMLDLAIWDPGGMLAEVYAFHQDTVYLDVPGACGMTFGWILPAAQWGSGGGFKSIAVHREARGDSSWGALSAAGTYGLQSVH